MVVTGLSSGEAQAQLKRSGSNVFERKSKVVWWRVLLSQFKSPLVYILLLAAVATVWLHEYTDAVVIGLAVVLNTLFGFVQEFRAGKALEALTGLLVPKAKVKRDGIWQEIDLAQVVPGDVARLELGQSVPADGVLINGEAVLINEAILTGESLPVDKKVFTRDLQFSEARVVDEGQWAQLKEENKCFQGTTVAGGIGEMLVIKTNGGTKLGQIAKTVSQGDDQATPLQRKLQKLGGALTIILAVVATLVFIVGLATGDPLAEIFPTAIALAVAAIPEGLLVGLTLILSLGMNRILKRRGLVRRLLAAETLGSVDVICLDKTGTITEGKHTVEGVITSLQNFKTQLSGKQSHKSEQYQKMLLGIMLCNDLQDPLEVSMDAWGRKQLGEVWVDHFKRLDSIPFSPKTKYIVVRSKDLQSNKVADYFSGAPEVVLEHCQLSSAQKETWLKHIKSLGKLGYRMVGMAWRPAPSDKLTTNLMKFKWLGLVVFTDPIRSGVEESLLAAKAAGINLKIITGDYQETAWSVLQKLNLVKGEADDKLVVTGDELREFMRTSNHREISQHIEEALLFARVTPDQKLAIVKALQEYGHVVAMTGDGVNDAPALRQADIGVVVSEGSDVAKETADMVLLDNNFATILAAVEEGRSIYVNLRRVLLYLMADAFAAIILVVGTIFLGWPLPILATQILWINLISDGFPNLALTVEPKDKDLLRRRPTGKKAPLLDHNVLVLTGVISLVAALLCLGLFYYFDQVLGVELSYARSVVFASLGSMTLVYVYSVRALTKGIWEVNPLRNPWLVLATLFGLIIQLSAIYWPPLMRLFDTQAIRGEHWLVILTAVIGLVVSIEMVKLLLRQLGVVNGHNGSSVGH